MTAVKKTIHAKLMAARAEFHSASIVKTGYNSFSKYNYFELADFLVPAMKIMADNDLIPIISFTADIATMTVYDITSEVTIVITSPMSTATLKACQPVQSLGAVETFQRRYLWVALLEVVEHDVIEENTGNPANKVPEIVPATSEQMAEINDFISEKKISPRRASWIKANANMTHTQAETILKECHESERVKASAE